jgi:DNA-binding transcriptional LysR family regulator
MLDLRRLRLLHELRGRGTIAAVADALQFTPSAVSQQLALLEREAGVALLERAGRGVRLTDAGLVLAEHAEALLDRVRLAEADLAAATAEVAGRVRIGAFQSVMLHLALPAIDQLALTAPRLRCELVEAEPEDALPLLALGDLDLVLADEWQHAPRRLPAAIHRHDLMRDVVRVVLPARHPVARRYPDEVPLAELVDAHWATGHPERGWEDMTERTCRDRGGFAPDIRHRANDANISLALVRAGLGVALLPDLPLLGRTRGVAIRAIEGGPTHRAIFAATRTADAARPSIEAALQEIRSAVPASA